MPFLQSVTHEIPEDQSAHPFDLPAVMAYPDAFIYRFGPSGIDRLSLRETDHYQITRRVLDNPERMFKQFLAEDDDSNEQSLW